MGLLEGTLMDIVVIGAGGALGAVGGALVQGYAGGLPFNLLVPVGAGLGAGAANSLYDLINSDRTVQLKVETKTAIAGGIISFLLINLGPSIPVLGPMLAGAPFPSAATAGFTAGAFTGWWMPSNA